MMRKSIVTPIALALLALALSSRASAGDWKAGAAKVVITPEKFMWMSGYGGRNKPAEGKLTDLYAKALAIEDPAGHRSLLITLDLVGIDRELSRHVSSRLSAEHKLARGDVALCVSHTHSGPVVGYNLRTMYVLDDEQNKLIDQYTAALEEKLIALGNEAIKMLAPATAEWGIGQADFAKNRRTNVEAKIPELMLAGTLRGPFDHDLPVLALRGASGELRASRDSAERLRLVRRLARLRPVGNRSSPPRRDRPFRRWLRRRSKPPAAAKGRARAEVRPRCRRRCRSRA